jgi:hypothetical protein
MTAFRAELAGPAGFEPATTALTVRGSTVELETNLAEVLGLEPRSHRFGDEHRSR